MDFISEFLIGGLIINFLGLYSRYYFFKLIGKPKDKKYLSGEKKIYDSTDKVQQLIYNFIIGLIGFTLISFSIAYIVFEVFEN